MRNLVRNSKRPRLAPELRAEFQRCGVDVIWAVLAASCDGHSGSSHETLLRVGNAVARRGEMADWLIRKKAVTDRWIMTGVFASVVAAIFSVIGVVG
jgi:hypothetical protein